MELNLNGVIAGNGILTVENRAQALKRAVDKNKGADAANAALALIALRDRFGSSK
jgi:6,7-dimethyl-8-ribityllumazine synthase